VIVIVTEGSGERESNECNIGFFVNKHYYCFRVVEVQHSSRGSLTHRELLFYDAFSVVVVVVTL
jgi:hypothetical protein